MMKGTRNYVSISILIALTACRTYCEEDDFFCDVPSTGLGLRIEAAGGGFGLGEWQFAFEIVAPDPTSGHLLCNVRADVPGKLICDAAVGIEAPYDLRVEMEAIDALAVRLTRDGVEPLANEGMDTGVSGPSDLRVEVFHDGVTQGSDSVEPDYLTTTMKSGPEVCVVCLAAEEIVEL